LQSVRSLHLVTVALTLLGVHEAAIVPVDLYIVPERKGVLSGQ
jgi:hypothetical protein